MTDLMIKIYYFNHYIMNTRLGYACINMALKEHKVCCNQTCRLDTAIKKGEESGFNKGSEEYSEAIYKFLCDYGKSNLEDMFKSIAWSQKHGIFFYRMSSDMFPHISNLRMRGHMTDDHIYNYSNLIFAKDIIYEIGAYAQKYGIRLTMHPGHYNQLGSKSEDVISNTIRDLSWHALLLDLLEEGAESYNQYLINEDREDEIKENVMKHGILCIHGGGTYKDKPETISRWKKTFKTVPEFIRRRIALENDERGYSVEDLLPICNELNIPLIMDFHHYNCWAYYHKDNPDQKPIEELLPQVLDTWKSRDMIPKFHLSDQAEGKKIGAHHDYVESIPDILLDLIDKQYKFDIMIEAKMKEKATLRLYKKYPNI